MEYLLIGATICLAIALIVLLLRCFALKRSVKEIGSGFSESLSRDTNAIITVNSSDKDICELASLLNRELVHLRREQLTLQSSSGELQQAVTNIAHDLRTPLTAINGYLELLEQEPLNEASERYVGIIRERTETLKSLTEELFRYSVISSTSEDLSPETLSLNDQLEVALAGAYQSFADRGITPEIEFPDAAVVRSLDKKALQRILGNILSNAAKYSDGDLFVRLTEDGCISFTNTALSLTEVEVGKLFDRFYTVENARGSTGLGLSIAKLLTDRMGGRISADYKDSKLTISVAFEK